MSYFFKIFLLEDTISLIDSAFMKATQNLSPYSHALRIRNSVSFFHNQFLYNSFIIDKKNLLEHNATLPSI